MELGHSGLVGRAAHAWVDGVVRRARLVVAGTLALTAAVAVYVFTSLGINTDATDMLSPDLPFRQSATAVDAAFPQLDDNIVVVIDGTNPDLVNEAADILRTELAKHEAVLGDVFDPAAEPVFRRNGFLYLDDDALASQLDRLVTAQPFIGKLWSDPTLVGLFATVELVLNNSGAEGATAPGTAASDLLTAMAATIEAQTGSRPASLSWRRLFEGEGAAAKRTFHSIVLQPTLDYSSLAPAGDAIDALRDIFRTLDLERRYDVRVRLTGSVALRHEELQTLRDNVGLASALSFVIVAILLAFGMRSAAQVGAIVVTLLVGLILTAGWATVSVGELNLISVAFAILFIGLGEDFGVHFALRHREEMQLGVPMSNGLATAAGDVGGALALSALTAAIGFLSFVPTDYRGLAELGIIAAGGMFIALLANLTLLPALLALWPSRPVKARHLAAAQGFTWDLRRIARPGAVVVTLCTLGCLAILPRLQFDFDPMNLRNPESESVRTVQDMMDAGMTGAYTADVLAPDVAAADALAAKLEALPSVESAETLSDFIPKNQDDRRAQIESAAFTLLPSMSAPPTRTAAEPEDRLAAFTALRRALNAYVVRNDTGELAAAAQRLLRAMSSFATTTLLEARPLTDLDRALTRSLQPRLLELKEALEPTGIAVEDLPERLRTRMVAADGRAKIEVFPKEDMRDRAKLRTFVTEVQSVAPTASGGPVTIVAASDTVMRAFAEAGIWSIAVIALLTLALLRSLRETIFIFVPLVMAAILTVGVSILIDMPFNFANVIVLPLLFGLGIASGIHMVLRERASAGALGVAETSTPRAVFFSTLTTIGSFGTVALSDHPGTASMGVLLTVAILLTLVCSLTVLPAMLARWPIAKGATSGATTPAGDPPSG